jgi:hypothetical protein
VKSLSSSAKLIRNRQAQPPAAAGQAAVRPRTWKVWLVCLGCVALSALVTIAGFEIFSPIRLPPEMRGTWVIVEGKQLKGATLEFFADGRLVGNVPSAGRNITLSGRVELRGNLFRVTAATSEGDEAVTEFEEILDLTERRFVVQDSFGELLILERPPAAEAPARGGAR